VAFINSEDEILENMSKRFEQPVLFPAEGDFLHISYTGADPYLSFKGANIREIKTQLIGKYNFYNVAAALCIGKYFEVPTELAEQAVADYKPDNNRSQVIKKGTNTIILDAYNANPSSMRAALTNLISMESPSKMAILGDMMELGDESEKSHKEVIDLTTNGLDKVFLCGPLMGMAKAANPKAQHFPDKIEMIDFLKKQDIRNTTILIKASRSIGLEGVVEYL
jgi:UDP-N-acetylmuramoyl-tripeptide--D-alanyl-D-alanine ligase